MMINPYLFTTAVTSSTWNPADKSANIVLSNSNLTATITTNTNSQGVRGTTSKSSGKWYFEVLVGVAGFSGVQIGVANSSASTSTTIGADTNGFSYDSASGKKFTNNVLTTYGSAFTNGDVVGVALDMDSGSIWFAKNNVWQASGDPVAGTGQAFSGIAGSIFPATSLKSGPTANDTARFSTANQTYAPPSGFTAWG